MNIAQDRRGWKGGGSAVFLFARIGKKLFREAAVALQELNIRFTLIRL